MTHSSKCLLFSVLPLIALSLAVTPPAEAAAFTAGDLVVYRVGTGSAALTSAATAVFLDEYTTTGTLVQSIALPSTGSTSGTQALLTASGTATSEGELNLSANGQFLALTGYDAASGLAGVASTSSTSTPRTVGIVGVNGIVDTSTTLSSAGITGNNIRGAVTTDGTNIYVADANNGVDFTTIGSTGTSIPLQIETTVTNARNVDVFGGQLYVSTSSGSTFRIATVGSGTPTTAGQTVTALSGLTSTSPAAPDAFYFTSLGGGTGLNTLYVADTNSIDKFSLVSGSWTQTGAVSGLTGVEGLTGLTTNGIASLYASDPNGIFSLTDGSGFDGTLAGTASQIVTAGTNEAFRGLAFAPSIAGAAAPEPTSIALSVFGIASFAGAALRRRRKQA